MSTKTVSIKAPAKCAGLVQACTPASIHLITRKGLTRNGVLKKLRGYGRQDALKQRKPECVTVEELVCKLVAARGRCTYCTEGVAVISYPPRYGKQWTLDRKDNSLGHTCDNTVISCLECNLRRRSRDHHLFLRGERMTFKKAAAP